MLASITPLGERSRGSSWWVTVSLFALGAIVAATLVGALLGGLGRLLGAGHWRGAVVAGAAGAALLWDLFPVLPLPTTRRQVNEDWLVRYRGWVYGVGFGTQLGIGGVTIVTSAATYAVGVTALLGAGPLGGAAVGGAFGGVRALSLLPARRAHDPHSLSDLHRWLAGAQRPAAALVRSLELAALAAAVAWLL
jgi:hypothetical protein